MGRIIYVELPATKNLAATKSFYAVAFGWNMSDYGPSYACTTTAEVNLGLQGDSGEANAAPLAVIEVDDLESALADVERAGGTITKQIFPFPGGRGFHFRDPSGNELAASVSD